MTTPESSPDQNLDILTPETINQISDTDQLAQTLQAIESNNKNNWSPVNERRIIQLKIQSARLAGQDPEERRLSAIASVEAEIQKRERQFGATPTATSLKYELMTQKSQLATDTSYLNTSAPSEGIYVNYLEEADVARLSLTSKSEVDRLIQLIDKQNRTFGECSIRTKVKWALFKRGLSMK